MNIALWIAQALFAAMMIAAGRPKLLLPPARLAEKMSWTKDAPAALVKLLGVAELLGAAGLILPRLTGMAPILSPIATVCLSLILVGALTTKLRHHQSPVLPALAMLLAVFIAAGRLHDGPDSHVAVGLEEMPGHPSSGLCSASFWRSVGSTAERVSCPPGA
jgi:hypothetical protein